MPDTGTGTDRDDWGAALRGLRRDRGLTLGQAAVALGAAPETLALLEAGELPASLDSAQAAALVSRYATALGVDGEWRGPWARSPDVHGPRATNGSGPAGGRSLPTGPARFSSPARRVSPSSRAATHDGGRRLVDVRIREPHLALKEARVRGGLTVEEAGVRLGMRPDFVTAMDRGDLGRLPRGHERSMLSRYAALVGLDSALVDEWLSEHGFPGPPAWPEAPAHPTRRALWIRFAGGTLVVAGLLLAAVGLS